MRVNSNGQSYWVTAMGTENSLPSVKVLQSVMCVLTLDATWVLPFILGIYIWVRMEL